MAWGSRAEGLLEIAYFNPKKKNASHAAMHLRMTHLIEAAQTDNKTKVILIHGGPFFSSGNDISALASGGSMSDAEKKTALGYGS